MRVCPYTRMMAALVLAATIGTGAAAAPPTVLELFTSQGCSSCPPADRLFAKLAGDPQFIVLSLPVDYWDRLGWKDTFAKHAFTERQVAYSRMRGDGQVYTPQAVVNGSEHANGGNRRAIDAAAATTAPVGVPLMAQQREGEIIVTVGAATGVAAQRATIVALPYFASREVAIGRGENARHKVTYTNIVRDIIPIGEWSGAPVTQKIALPRGERYDGVVVLLQEGSVRNPGAILGADRIALR